MSLYDGLDISDKEVKKDKKNDLAGWSSGFKLLQSQLQAKKVSHLQNKKQRTTPTMAPVVDLKRNDEKSIYFNQRTGRMERTNALGGDSSPFLAGGPGASFMGCIDEYDPLRPNEYEEVVKRRKEQKQKERDIERQREMEERERRRKERHKERGYDDNSDEERRRFSDEEEDDRAEMMKRGAGAAIAPPPSLMESTGPDNPLDIMPHPDLDGMAMGEDNEPRLPGASFGLAGSVASKIMAKYGYKEGSGLGKKEQGMSIALQVEKTSKRGGKIIHEKDLPKDPPKADLPNTNILKNPSKVILLRNMVGPGEVDEELEPETAEECSKYGKVNKCLIFEIPNVPEDEAVRIFVEFEKMESAIKAVIDLNGRFFGGRVVKGGFYNLDKFRQLDLADPVV